MVYCSYIVKENEDMTKHKKERFYYTKKAAERAESSRMQPSTYSQFTFLSKLPPKNKKAAIKISVLLFFVIAIAGFIPLPYTFAKTVTVPFDITDKKSTELELGDTKVLQEGANGSKVVQVESLHNTWGRLFGLQPTQQKETTSTISKPPVDRVVANGTIKYQYMLCSDGSSRYYTDEQFKDPNTGFTSKSEDYCKANNQGHKVSLSNSNPANNISSSTSTPASTTQPYSYEAEKIDREVAKLNWCIEQDDIISNEYIGKVHQAQATEGITDKEFNAIVDPAYWKYSLNIRLLRASGCTISNPYPDFTRQ